MKVSFFYGFIILILALLTIPPMVSAVSVGVSPSLIDLGEIELGSTGIGKFYVVTPGEENILVRLDTYVGNSEVFDRDGYREMVLNYSEEEARGWISFPKDMVEITSSGQVLKTRGGAIRGWKEAAFYIKVPQDAEPGFHNFIAGPMPFIPGTGADNVINIRAVANIPVIFKVPGTAVRRGEILDVSYGDYVNGMLGINTFFTNTGTVTISAKVDEAKIFDKYGKLLGSTSSGFYTVKPGETKSLRSYVSADGITVGEYDVTVNVSYRTGYTYKEASITIYEKPITGYAPAAYQPPYIPLWLFIIPIILISYVIYRWSRQ